MATKMSIIISSFAIAENLLPPLPLTHTHTQFVMHIFVYVNLLYFLFYLLFMAHGCNFLFDLFVSVFCAIKFIFTAVLYTIYAHDISD